MKKIIKSSYGLLLLFALLSCNPDNREPLAIDFSVSEENLIASTRDVGESLNVAVAAMVSPKETYVFYEELFNYITKKTGSRVVFKQRKTYEEVNLMLENKEVDIAFICSGAYSFGKEKSDMEILVIPVSNGKKYYRAYVVVHASSDIYNFKDLQNKKFAFTDSMSHCGRLYPEKRLKELNVDHSFFSKIIYSNAHDMSMQLVAKQIVDGASIQNPVFDYIAKVYPERVKNLRIIERSEYYGMPPIVVPASLEREKKDRLKELFLTIHEEPEGKKILDKLFIDRFIEGDDQDYNSIREIRDMLTN